MTALSITLARHLKKPVLQLKGDKKHFILKDIECQEEMTILQMQN